MSTEEPSEQVLRRASAGALVLVAIVSAALGGGAVYIFLPKQPPGATAQEKKELYQCPMHPQIAQDRPGDCPICGMDLVKASTDSTSAADAPGLATVDIDPAR